MKNKRQLFLNHVAQTSELPLMLEVDRAEGIYVYDTEGKTYINLISGISVSSLGHCHPAVVQAVKDQVDRYMHTMVYGEHVQSPQVELATLLTDQLPKSLDSVYFVNSGSEAVEGAMKLAKRVTGRTKILSCKNAYHGSTHGSMSLMSDTYFTQAYRPLLPDVYFIEYNNEATLTDIDDHTACVVMETIQAEAGVIMPKDDFLKKVRQRCDEVGALLIFDEIQVGYGRTGSLFAFEQYGVVPDILLLAKAMGGGMPIGAFVASKAHMDTFSFNPVLGHITTFGGHPVVCAAGIATLKTLIKTDYISLVKEKAQRFLDQLTHPLIQEIRCAGFLMAIDLGSFERVQTLMKLLMTHGVITDWFLFNDKCFRIAPPLIITNEEIDIACQKILTVLDDIQAGNYDSTSPKLSF